MYKIAGNSLNAAQGLLLKEVFFDLVYPGCPLLRFFSFSS